MQKVILILLLSMEGVALPNRAQLLSHKFCARSFVGEHEEHQPKGPLPGAFDHPDTQRYFNINPRRRLSRHQPIQRPVEEATPVVVQTPEPPPPPAPARKPTTPEQNLAAALVYFLRPDLFSSGSRTDMPFIMDALFDVQAPLANAGAKTTSLVWSSFFDVKKSQAEQEHKKRLTAFWRKLGLHEVFTTLYSDNPELRVTSPMSLVEMYRAMRECCTDVEPFEHYAALASGVRVVKKFKDPHSRGPLALLTVAKLQKLAPGTVIWNLEGEFQIIGAGRVHFGEEDYVWGVRPLEHEFDTTPRFLIKTTGG